MVLFLRLFFIGFKDTHYFIKRQAFAAFFFILYIIAYTRNG